MTAAAQIEGVRTKARPKMTEKQRRRAVQGYLFLSPWLFGFFAFTALPIVISIGLAFTRYSVLRPAQFIGLQNFRHALMGGDALLWPSIGRSFYYALMSVPLGLAASLTLAVLLNQHLAATAVWRTFYFLPTLTPSVATAYLWRWLLNNDIGVFRMVFDSVGIRMPNWLGSMEWAIPSLVMISVWAGAGGAAMIIFLAGLQDVPVELTEAAEIDGANRWRKFWSITIPLLSPVIFFNMIMGVIGALRVFDVAFVATGGGPSFATWFISLHIYRTAFMYFDMGYAAAMAWVLVVIIVSLTMFQFRLSSGWVFYQGEAR
jgi:multiple sugar transport system permease protein